MKEKIKHIKFDNQDNPKSFFEIVKIEELLGRQLDHDIFKNHIVKFYIIFFVTEGKGSHTIDFTNYKYQAGTILLIRKDQVHKFFQNTTVKGFLLVFTEEFIISHLNTLEALKCLQLFNELLHFPKIDVTEKSPEFSNLSSLVWHLEAELSLKDEYSTGIMRSALHIMITRLFRIKSEKGEAIEQKKYLEEFLAFQEMVEKECFNSKKVKYYAQKMGYSTKTLNNIVQTIVSKSAKVFIDEIAIMQIKRLLISTNQSVKEIAYTVGFDDSTNFFKYFKKYVSTSPEVFRQTYR